MGKRQRHVQDMYSMSWRMSHCLEINEYSIVLNSEEQPVAIIKTVEVSLVPMNEVSEEFAIAEGEGPYEDWKSAHVRFFTSELRELWT